MSPEEFRDLGHGLIDWIADYRANIAKFPVMSTVVPGAIRRQLPSHPPPQGQNLRAALDDLARILLPGITHWNHPAFFAYFPSNMSLPAILGDLVSAGLGVQGMSWQTSPAATELEEVVMDWFRQMLGLSERFSGVIHDTASTATLCALLCARERATNFSQNRSGLAGEKTALTVYASEQAHSSVEKAALLAGFGKENLRLIATDAEHALQPEALSAAIREDLAAGRRPCAVVATTGTTATTALDPLEKIAALAKQYGLWLHVDAAMAGSAMILPECRWMWRGVEAADSLVVNAHKWLGSGFDLSAYYVSDPQHLVRVMSTNPSYLRTVQDDAVKNFRDWGIPLGRRFRALRLWFLIREQGVQGLQARLRRDLQNAQRFQQLVRAAPAFELLAPVYLQTVCLRHVPPGACAECDIAKHNLAIADRINRSGRAYLTPAVLKGRQMLRVSIGAELTEWPHVEALWRELQQAAAV